MTPAILVQPQQVMSVLWRAKPVQEQHLAEVFSCLLDQLGLSGCVPATHTAGNQGKVCLACRGNAAWLTGFHMALTVQYLFVQHRRYKG